MPISTIAITNTIDFGRQVLNQISSNINSLLASGVTTTGNLIVRGADASHVSLNVAVGVIAGNGVNLFSVNARSVTINTLRNSQLQNSSITVVAGVGTNGGGVVSLGSAIRLNLVPVNSFTNTWANIAVAAAAVSNANAVIFSAGQNASLVTSGTLQVQYGGTGYNTYSGVRGATLIGTTEGSLVANTIRPGAGISASYGNGSLSFSANLVAGQNVQIINGNRIRLLTPVASTTTNGFVQLNDTLTSTSTTQAATANAINAAYVRVDTTLPPTLPDVSGRLIQISVYSTPGVYTWTKPANTRYIDIIMIGAGGGGAGANSGNLSAATYTYGMGGYAGALLYASIANDNVHSTMTVTVGHGGNSTGAIARVGYKGGDTIFANTANSSHAYYANGGNGGLTVTVTNSSANLPIIHTWNTIARERQYGYLYQDELLTPALATASVPSSIFPQPEYSLRIAGEPSGVFMRLSPGNVIGSIGGSVPGWCAGGGVSYSVNTAISGGANCITYGPDGGTAAQQPNGSGFGGGGGGGAFNESRGAAGAVSGASGANGLVIIKVYSRV